VLWGGSFFFSKVAVGDFPPLTVALGRVTIAAAVLHILVRARRVALPSSLRAWAPYVVMGLFNNVLPFGLIFWGQTHIGSGLAATLNATVPLFSALITHVVAHTPAERLNPRRSLGLGVGFLGVVVLVGPDALGGIGDNVLAQFAVLAAAVSYGISAAYSRRFYGIPPLRSATAQLTCSTALLLPVVALTEQPWNIAAPSLAAWSSLLALAIICTALGYLIFFRVLASAGALNLVLVTFLIPVTAMLLGSLFLDEVITWSTLLAMAIISLGLAIIDGRLWRRLRATFGKRDLATA
jgi:drug/metabolite transporter (DMT)-like permease